MMITIITGRCYSVVLSFFLFLLTTQRFALKKQQGFMFFFFFEVSTIFFYQKEKPAATVHVRVLSSNDRDETSCAQHHATMNSNYKGSAPLSLHTSTLKTVLLLRNGPLPPSQWCSRHRGKSVIQKTQADKQANMGSCALFGGRPQGELPSYKSTLSFLFLVTSLPLPLPTCTPLVTLEKRGKPA
jgi:hypothetical protein